LVEKQIEAKALEKKITVEEATIELVSEKQPSKQFVQVSHLGDVAVFLCSESASQITGVSIPVDGYVLKRQNKVLTLLYRGWTSQ
jgi:3-hydroxybutyrate dehydrogenase